MGWYIEYRVFSPVTNQMERQRMKLNTLKRNYARQADFRAHANKIVCELAAKLAGGWSPLMEYQDQRLYMPLSAALDEFLKSKERDLRKATMVSYKSTAGILMEWLTTEVNAADCQASYFNHTLAVRFMDWLYSEPSDEEQKRRRKEKRQPRKALSANAWNTYLKKYRAIFSWMVEHCYMKENPFTTIKKKKAQAKTRGLIPPEYRKKVFDYCSEHEPNYILVCKLIYSSLIRPKEIEMIQIKDIHLKEGYIRITEDKAKTHFERTAPLTDDLINHLQGMHLEHYPENYYLIGTDYIPSEKPAYHGKYKKDWMKIREDLKLPAAMQLYSFKDSGITEMLEAGMDPLTVMKIADHHDLSITTKYASHVDPDLLKKVREQSPSF